MMGFFKRLQSLAIRAEAKRLRPFMRADEHFLETDVVELVVISFHEDGKRVPGGQVAMSLTSHAIYLRPMKGEGSTLRIPYERLVDLAAAQGMTELVTMVASYLIKNIGPPMGGDKFETIQLYMRKVENHRQEVDVPGGRVRAIHRPFDEGETGAWLFQTTEGVDLGDIQVRQALERALAPAIERYGSLM